ncbi:MAG TPA: hypothetical protein VMV10_17300 [Pirellulales bacterium]|nr:hypothetical protein [Pirellulales bacterium]
MSNYPSEDERRYVRVTCPKCRAVLHPRVEKAGRRVRCPDCYAAVLVPQPEEPKPPPKPARDPGQYKLGGAVQPTGKPDYFLLLCPTCQARLHPRQAHVGKKVRCPDCEAVIVVPPPPPEPKKPKELKSPGQYRVGTEPARVEVKQELLLVQGTLAAEPPPPDPPRFWFASGVCTFPWRKSAAACWLTLAMFLLPLGVLLGAVVYLIGGLHQGSTVVAMLVVPIAWTFLWSMSYAADCSLGIIEGTASGEDDVTRWPEGSWRERIGPLVYVGFEFVLGAAAASLLAWPVGMFFGPVWMGLAVFVLFSLTFPLILLSALEADSPMTPYSPVILGSLPKLWWAWGIVAFESIGVTIAAVGLTLLAALATPALALFAAPPLMAAAIFIVARLYGRLAWRIGELEAEKKRRKKKKKKKRVQDAAARSE